MLPSKEKHRKKRAYFRERANGRTAVFAVGAAIGKGLTDGRYLSLADAGGVSDSSAANICTSGDLKPFGVRLNSVSTEPKLP